MINTVALPLPPARWSRSMEMRVDPARRRHRAGLHDIALPLVRCFSVVATHNHSIWPTKRPGFFISDPRQLRLAERTTPSSVLLWLAGWLQCVGHNSCSSALGFDFRHATATLLTGSSPHCMPSRAQKRKGNAWPGSRAAGRPAGCLLARGGVYP